MNPLDSPSAYENDQMDEDDIQNQEIYSHGGEGRDYDSLEMTKDHHQHQDSSSQIPHGFPSSISEKDSKTILHSDFKKSFPKAEKAMNFTFKIPLYLK